MITIALCGGLGNQMFQFATGYALARRYGVGLRLEVSLLSKDEHREYVLDRWDLMNASLVTLKAMKGTSPIPIMHRVTRRLSSVLGGTRHVAIYRSGYDESVAGCGPSAYLEGYFQSWRYFNQYHDEICNLFKPGRPLSEESLAMLDRIRHTESVSLHIRRGDYVSNSRTNAYHGVCDVNYYQRAIQHVSSIVEHLELFVFSDEPAWAAQNLKLGLPATIVSRSHAPDVHEDMILMQMCKHNIIANSTYSWWSAYLNANRSRVVVAPLRWFLSSNDPGTDLIPTNWIRL